MKPVFITLVALLSGLSTALIAQTKQINSFDELITAVKCGGQVRMVIHYSKCELIADNEKQEKVPDAIGGMTLDIFEYFAPNSVKNKEAFLVASESKLIQNPKGEDYVFNYVKVRLNADGKVKITARYLKPETFKVLMDENFFGFINDGKNEGGVFLYINE
ncbi:MAG: VirK family protein [Bacteroidota bacterium]